MRTLTAFTVLFLFAIVVACRKSDSGVGHCHVVCASTYPGFQLIQMDSTQTDTMYYKAFVGDGDFSTPVYTRQLNAKELNSIRMYPDSSYELDIPAIGKEYRIKNIRINLEELDYEGHRCTPTICFSRPARPIVNGDSVALTYGSYGSVYVPLYK